MHCTTAEQPRRASPLLGVQIQATTAVCCARKPHARRCNVESRCRRQTADKNARTHVLQNGRQAQLTPECTDTSARALWNSLALHDCKIAKKSLAVASAVSLSNRQLAHKRNSAEYRHKRTCVHPTRVRPHIHTCASTHPHPRAHTHHHRHAAP